MLFFNVIRLYLRSIRGSDKNISKIIGDSWQIVYKIFQDKISEKVYIMYDSVTRFLYIHWKYHTIKILDRIM